MRVMLHGVNSENKGAQLLLAAAAHELHARGHDVVVSVRDVGRTARKSLDVDGYLNIERLRGARSLGLDHLPSRVVRALPVQGDSSFDYVLDASGFSLTDAWGYAPIQSRLTRLARWHGKGIGFAMLPQAFGPFTKPALAAGVAEVVAYADGVWARDPVSRDFVSSVGADARKVHTAPDITIGYSLDMPSQSTDPAQTLLVPNWNLAARSNGERKNEYVDSLISIARGLRARGHDVVGLSHEGARDTELITAVAAGVGNMDVIAPSLGTECKQIIASSRLVVAGRYHALVSALSSSVPVVGHSWSHKYEALMSDFAVQDGLSDPYDAAATLDRVDKFDLDAEVQRLKERLPQLKVRVSEMWDQVGTLIEHRQT